MAKQKQYYLILINLDIMAFFHGVHPTVPLL